MVNLSDASEIKYFANRKEWRHWLENHFEKKSEVWLKFFTKDSERPSVSYNDAVEEALCFGWIDSIVKPLDAKTRVQRFTPRRMKSSYSQPNIERLKWLQQRNLIHPQIAKQIKVIIEKNFHFPDDIIDALMQDKIVWKNYLNFSASYRRIRISYIEAARNRPEEFEKRLTNFINKTRQGKLIKGHGGIDKYYL